MLEVYFWLIEIYFISNCRDQALFIENVAVLIVQCNLPKSPHPTMRQGSSTVLGSKFSSSSSSHISNCSQQVSQINVHCMGVCRSHGGDCTVVCECKLCTLCALCALLQHTCVLCVCVTQILELLEPCTEQLKILGI